MKRIAIDISGCQTVDELYIALLAALGAPSWHGRNLDALWDSVTRDFNDISPPYVIRASGREYLPEDVAVQLGRIQALFVEAREKAGAAIELDLG